MTLKLRYQKLCLPKRHQKDIEKGAFAKLVYYFANTPYLYNLHQYYIFLINNN